MAEVMSLVDNVGLLEHPKALDFSIYIPLQQGPRFIRANRQG